MRECNDITIGFNEFLTAVELESPISSNWIRRFKVGEYIVNLSSEEYRTLSTGGDVTLGLSLYGTGEYW